MVFAAKGVRAAPLAGSVMVEAKMPWRCAAVGTVEKRVTPVERRADCQSAKKKVRLARKGPPRVAPKRLRRNSGFAPGAAKRLRAFSASLRWYSNSDPCHWFVPARVLT